MTVRTQLIPTTPSFLSFSLSHTNTPPLSTNFVFLSSFEIAHFPSFFSVHGHFPYPCLLAFLNFLGCFHIPFFLTCFMCAEILSSIIWLCSLLPFLLISLCAAWGLELAALRGSPHFFGCTRATVALTDKHRGRDGKSSHLPLPHSYSLRGSTEGLKKNFICFVTAP